jgi:hypothetical protein
LLLRLSRWTTGALAILTLCAAIGGTGARCTDVVSACATARLPAFRWIAATSIASEGQRAADAATIVPAAASGLRSACLLIASFLVPLPPDRRSHHAASTAPSEPA